MPFNKSTRSYYFRSVVFEHAVKTRHAPLTWREARLMFKGATVAAILFHKACNKVRS